MKRLFKAAGVLCAVVAVCFVSSCAKESLGSEINTNMDPYAISFTEGINTMATRATEVAFEAGDEISVTAYSGGSEYATNKRYTYSASLFSSDDPIIYPQGDEDGLSYRAVYPYVELSADKEVEFTIKTDQSLDSNYTLSDLMSASLYATTDEVPKLQFQHMLTKMVFKITDADIDLNGAAATVCSSTSITYALGNSTYEITDDVEDVTMVSDDGSSFKAIILPQSYAVGDKFGVITVGGESYELYFNTATTLSAGVQYSYSLTISDGEVTFDDATIEDWSEYESDDDYEETSQIYVSSVDEFNAIDLSSLAEGEVIVWKNGTYDSQSIDIEGDGTSSKPIRLRAETPGEVIFTGSSSLILDGTYIEVSGFWWKNPNLANGTHLVYFSKGSQYCKVSNCAISGYDLSIGSSTAGEEESKWVSMYGYDNTLDSCTIVDKKNEGCTVVVWFEGDNVTPRHTISNNYFERSTTIYNGSAINGQETIRIGTSTYSMSDGGCLVEGNHFYQCHGEQAECISNKSGDNTYRNNLFEETKSSLTLRHGNGCLVEYNYFEGGGESSTGGIRIIGEDHIVRYNYLSNVSATGNRAGITLMKGNENTALSGYSQVKNAAVYGNTLVSCTVGLQVNYDGNDYGAIGTTISDNTVYAPSSSYTYVSYSSVSGDDITWSGNTFGTSGKFSGLSFDVTSNLAEPTYPTDEMQAIRDGAGCSWTVE